MARDPEDILSDINEEEEEDLLNSPELQELIASVQTSSQLEQERLQQDIQMIKDTAAAVSRVSGTSPLEAFERGVLAGNPGLTSPARFAAGARGDGTDNFFEQLGVGITFGRDPLGLDPGEPDNFIESIGRLGGNLIGGFGAAYLGAAATPVIGSVLGATRLGSAIFTRLPQIAQKALPLLSRVGIEGGTVAALSPEEDLSTELAITGVAELILNNPFNIGSIIGLSKVRQLDEFKSLFGGKTIKTAKELKAETDRIQSIATKFKEVPPTRFEQQVKDIGDSLIKLDREVNKAKAAAKKATENFFRNKKFTAGKLVDDEIEIIDREAVRLAERLSKNEIFSNPRTASAAREALSARLFGKHAAVFNNAEDLRDLVLKRIPRAPGEEALSRGARFRQLPEDIQRGAQRAGFKGLPREVTREVDRFLKKVSDADTARTLGLHPDSSPQKIAARQKKLEEKLREVENSLVDNNRIKNLRDEVDQKILKALDSPNKTFTKEFPLTTEAMTVLKNAERVMKEQPHLDTLNRFEKVIKQVEEGQGVVNEEVNKAIRDQVSLLSRADAETLQTAEDLIAQARNIDDIPDIDTARRAITSLMREFIDRNAGDVVADLPQRQFRQELTAATKRLAQAQTNNDRTLFREAKAQIEEIKAGFSQAALTQPQVLAGIVGELPDPAIQKMHLLFRGLHGDTQAANTLAFMENSADVTLDRVLSARVAFNELPPSQGDPLAKAEYIANATDTNAFIRQFTEADKFARHVKTFDVGLGTETQRVFDKMADAELEHIRWYEETMQQRHIQPLAARLRELSDETREAAKSFLISTDEFATTREIDLINDGMSIDAAREQITEEINERIAQQSDDVQDIYYRYRAAADEVYDLNLAKAKRVNEMIDEGLLPGMEKVELIEKRPGYFTHTWEGAYRVTRVTTDEKTGFTQFKTIGIAKNDAEAVEIMEQYAKENPGAGYKLGVEPRIFTSTQSDLSLYDEFGENVKQMFSRPVDEIRDLLATKRLSTKTLKPTFFGNRMPRESDAKGFITDPVKSLELYAYSGGKHANYLEPVAEMEILARRFERTASPATGKRLVESAEYIRTLANDVIGKPRDSQRKLDKLMLSTLETLSNIPVAGAAFRAIIPPGSQLSNAFVGSVLALGRISTIGFNMSTALINTALFGHNVLPLAGVKHSLAGIRKLAKGIEPGSKYDNIIKKSNIRLFSGGAALRDALDSPTVKTGLGKGIEWVDSMGMWFFNKTETATRAASIITGRDLADDLATVVSKKVARNKDMTSKVEQLYLETAQSLNKSLLSDEVKDEFALRFMNLTNHNFNKSALPEAFRNTSLKPFLQFKTFMFKQLQFMFGQGLSTQEFVKVMGATTAIGGVFAIPGLNFMDQVMTAHLGFSPRKEFQEAAGDAIAAGLPRLAGVDISQRLAVDDLQFAVGRPADIFGILPANLIRAANAVIGERDPGKAMSIMTPVAIRNLFDAKELFTRGEIRSNFTGDIKVREEDFANPVLAGLAKSIGFEPNEMRDTRHMSFLLQAQVRNYNRNRKLARDLIAEYAREGNMEAAFQVAKEEGISRNDVAEIIRDDKKTRLEKTREQLPISLRRQLINEED